MAQVEWTRGAIADLAEISAFIAEHSPDQAKTFADRLRVATERLEEFPLSGRVVPELTLDFRELIFRAYRIIYRVRDERVQVLAVIHGRRALDSSAING